MNVNSELQSETRPPGGTDPGKRMAFAGGRLAHWCVAWFRAKNPVLRFAVVFGLLIGLFYFVLILSPFFKQVFFPPYLRFNARMASAVCNWFGQHTSTSGGTISSARFSVQIAVGCDGSEPLALFMAAMLAFPAPFRRKIPGLLLGVVILTVVNLVRIVSLFLAGVYYPQTVASLHAEVWPAAFILLVIVLWAIWIQWAMKPRPATLHAPS